MTPKIVIKPAGAAPAVGPYNHAIRFGDLLYCSGQIPLDPANPDAPFPADVRAQTRQVIANIETILKAQGLTLQHAVKTTVFMINLADFAAMNEVYAQHFGPDYPARSAIQVAALPRGAAVEIEVVAHY
jgi:2-iminobutanoate/2-iminopropanoate deaminase